MIRPRSVIVLLGTRPEAIKMAPVILELRRHPYYDVTIVSTGQHREMMQPILNFFGIEPDLDLDLMRPGQSLPDISAAVLAGLERAFGTQKVDGIFVQGDTASCMAASLWGFLKRVPVFHVEAGLRTGDLTSPWPEEFNRRLTAVATTLHFAPTPRSAFNLVQEGHARESVHMVGNTVIDALLHVSRRLDSEPELKAELETQFAFLNPAKKLLLATVHRRENFGLGLKQIFKALRCLAEREDVQVVLPLHLNPQVQSAAREILTGSPVILIEPQAYVAFVYLMKRADLLLSDSGGVQEEAPALGKPVLVLRETTERPESVEAGNCILVGTQTVKILTLAHELLHNSSAVEAMRIPRHPYGHGDSSQRIVRLVSEYLQMGQTAADQDAAAELSALG